MEQRWRTRCFAPSQGHAATTPGCVTAAAPAVLATAGAHSGIHPGAHLHGNGVKQVAQPRPDGWRRAAGVASAWWWLLVGMTRHGGSSSWQRRAAREAAMARRQRCTAGVTSTCRRLDGACLLARHDTTNFA
jgi:hypothetical protein